MQCTDEVREVIAYAQTATIQSSHQDHDFIPTDLCSPLCMCCCCGGIILESSPSEPSDTPSLISNPQTIHLRAFITEPSFTIWQPPKV